MKTPPHETSTRRPTRLRIAAALASLAAITPLSGCFDAQAGITISGDDRVSGVVQITPTEASRSQFADWQIPDDLTDRVSHGIVDSSTGKMEVEFNDLHFMEVTEIGRAHV